MSTYEERRRDRLISSAAAMADMEEWYKEEKKKAADKLKSLERLITWNIGRLANLVMSDEDRQQTEDYIMDLRQERESLKRCFNG